MIKLTSFILLFFIYVQIQLSAQATRWIDDIVPDPALDDATFKICTTEGQIIQYFNDGKSIQYKGGKPAIDSIFFSTYQFLNVNESGVIRIRFIVNCSGKTGRFRLLSADLNYQPYRFSPEITTQLLRITKAMPGWQPKIWQDRPVDYYQYLIFKIEKGKLTHILP